MSAYLYINSHGKEVKSFSYSAGQLFHECAQKYKLARLDGWKERELRASMEFGKVLENAIQAYHMNRSVEDALKMFPGTDMAGIEFVAYIDMRVRSKITLGDALGIDIKAMNKPIPEGMLSLDPQICTYAWVTGISDWAFLNFIKTGREFERGTQVSFLEKVGELMAGQTGVVIKYQAFEPAEPAQPANTNKPKSKPKAEVPAVPEQTWIVKDDSVVELMFEQCGRGQTKEEKEKRLAFIQANATLVDKSILTKQKIQFVQGHIGLTEQLEASKRIAHDTVQIVYSNNENYWPRSGGIRFPNDSCTRCQMRGLCLNNTQLSDTLVVRSDEEWDAQKETQNEDV